MDQMCPVLPKLLFDMWKAKSVPHAVWYTVSEWWTQENHQVKSLTLARAAASLLFPSRSLSSSSPSSRSPLLSWLPPRSRQYFIRSKSIIVYCVLLAVSYYSCCWHFTGVTLADEDSYFLLDPDPIKVHHPLLPLEALFSAGRLPGLANFLSGPSPSPIILYPLFLGTTMAEVMSRFWSLSLVKTLRLNFGSDSEAEFWSKPWC